MSVPARIVKQWTAGRRAGVAERVIVRSWKMRFASFADREAWIDGEITSLEWAERFGRMWRHIGRHMAVARTTS